MLFSTQATTQWITRRIHTIGIGLSILVGLMAIAPPLPALARPAALRTNSPNSPINLRSRPSINGVVAYQSRSNAAVEVLEEQVGDDGYLWYFVRLENSGAGGWVREDLLRFVGAQPPTAVPVSSDRVPSAALETCRDAAFARLNTFRGDVSIPDARTTDSGLYEIVWRQQSTSQTGVCTLNRRNELISIRTTPTSTPANPSSPAPSAPEESLYRFRTDTYVVRLYRQGDQVRMNLREVDPGTTILDGAPVERVEGDRVDIYLSMQAPYEYQVRVTPQRDYQLTIYQGDRRTYQQTGTGF